MRESCTLCVCKHLAQACVLNTEALLGYPLHRYLAIGHLAEAEAESLKKYGDLAEEIREHRLNYTLDESYAIPYLSLIKKASEL